MNQMSEFYAQMGLSKSTVELVEKAEMLGSPRWEEHEKIAFLNQGRVLKAFQDNKIALRHFAPSSGYGYEDESKLALDRVYADVFGTQDAIVRPQIVSGTHCLCICLFGLLRPGESMLCLTGAPYDTIQKTIGIKKANGSLKEWGIGYRQIELLEGKKMDIDAALDAIRNDTSIKLVYIQRSRGYANRQTQSVAQIGEAIQKIKAIKDITVMVDNCYGEFVEAKEPTHLGADIMAGSLIKNPGGGIAPTGGYIVGRQDLIDKVADRFSAPGLGKDTCSYGGSYTNFFQGLFLAPHVVLQSIKGGILLAGAYELLGYALSPKSTEPRSDLIQSITFDTQEELVAFCQGIQKAAPVDSFVLPEPWDMPGYASKIIMAAGAFVQGSSIELSADAPLRSPYIAFAQGGLTYEHVKLGVLHSIQAIKNNRP